MMRRTVLIAIAAGMSIACAACTAPNGGDPATSTPANADSTAPASANAGSGASAPAAAGSTAFAPQPFSTAITAEGFRAYDKAISSDAMAGRQPGTPGADRAVTWIVQQFKDIGVEPGNNGSWFQKVPFVSTTLENPDQVKLTVDEGGGTQTFDAGKDIVAMSWQAKPHVSVKDSDIVFVGYGVVAPEYDWNDYKSSDGGGVDVKGKTVVVLVNDPGFGDQDPSLFKGKAMTYYGRWTYKYEECARQGAAMCVVVHTSDTAAGYPWSVVKNSWGGPQLSLPASEDPEPRVPVAGWITRDAAQRLFAKAGMDFDKLAAAADHRDFKAVPLDATASITLDSKIDHGSSRNVLGLIKGTARPDEVIVYSAHWDHLGTDDSLKGDQIFNGAIDNGTGVATLLEIAGAFAQQDPAPERSVLFFIPTLEESGLLGSLYYTKHPVFPMDQTVADINMDAMDVIGPTRNLQIIGNGQSHLEDMLKAVLKQQGRYAIPDQTPENGFYYRSDHFSFAKAGVPALMTQTGNDKVDGGVKAGTAALADYTANRYHTPLDNFNPDWDFSGVATDAQAFYEVGRKLAADDQWPKWNEDSEFRAKREKMMQH